jgi:hypothetical protein
MMKPIFAQPARSVNLAAKHTPDIKCDTDQQLRQSLGQSIRVSRPPANFLMQR